MMLEQVRLPLRHRAFRTVWCGETLSMLGDYSFEVAFVWLVFQETGSAGALAAVLLVQTVPRGVLLLVGGAVTDRVSPRTVMLCSHLVRGTAVGMLGLLAVMDDVQVWHLYALGAVAGVAEAFFMPAQDSILPSLLPTEQIPRGNALVGFGEQGARFLGPLLGASLVAMVGTPAAILLNSGTFFVAAWTVLAAPRRRSDAEESKPLSVIGSEIVEGLRYTRKNREARTVLMIIGAAALSYSGLFAVALPALAKSFSQDSMALGLLLSAWGLGQLTGTIAAVFTGLPRRWGILIIGMTLTEGVAFMLLGVLPNVWLAAATLALLGVGVAYSSDVALPTFIQTRTPEEVLGRINSVMYLPRVVLEPISLAVMGLLVTGDLRVAFAVAAVPVLAVGIRLAFDSGARGLTTATEEPQAAPAAGPGAV
ncbi:MFS transporter [Streptomyces enissocaesilis]|uniref:MFS transporter n=2 Tax=Streptomyces enissocaesilis TaxID=332589 RepID=A0ABP6JR44_9ACTN